MPSKKQVILKFARSVQRRVIPSMTEDGSSFKTLPLEELAYICIYTNEGSDAQHVSPSSQSPSNLFKKALEQLADTVEISSGLATTSWTSNA